MMNRWVLLDGLRPHSRSRIAACRRKRVCASVQAQKTPEGHALSGVLSCGSVWGCPACAARICSHRGDEIKAAVERWREGTRAEQESIAKGESSGIAGRVLSMLTLTVRHERGFELRKMRKGMAAAWRSLWQGRAGVERKRAWGIKHSVRALEVTHGEHGWHPHYHIALFQNRTHTADDVAELTEAWANAVVKHLGGRYRPNARGVDVKPLNVTSYLTKLGLEVASSAEKKGRNGSLSPWQIAQRAANGDARCVRLWREYAKAMKGARQLFWSRGARRALRLGVELSDREVAKDGEGCVLVQWAGCDWDAQCKADPFWVSRVQAAMTEGIEALKKLPGASLVATPPVMLRPNRIVGIPWGTSPREPPGSELARLLREAAQCRAARDPGPPLPPWWLLEQETILLEAG